MLAVDPVALSYLLRATGSVTLPNGDHITSTNAVSVLLNQVYLPRNTRLTGDFSEVGAVAANRFNGGTMLSYLVTLSQGQRSVITLRVLTPVDTKVDAQQTPTVNR